MEKKKKKMQHRCAQTDGSNRDQMRKKRSKDTSHIEGDSANVGTKTKLPPDEQRCSHTSGTGWRCKNFRMGHGDDDSVPKSRNCEKHYYAFGQMRKKRSKDSEGATIDVTSDIVGDSANVGTKTKNTKKLPPDEQRCSRTCRGFRCKNFRMGYGAAAAGDDCVPNTKHCEKHYNLHAKIYKNLKEKNRSGNGDGASFGPIEEDDPSLGYNSSIQGDSANVGTKKKLPPDGQRCVITGGRGWRCKNFRMGHGAAADDDTVPKAKYCEKHYNYYAEVCKKKSSRNGDTLVDGGGSAKIGAKRKHVETRASKRRKNVTEGDMLVAEASNQPATDDNCHSDTIVEGGSDNNGRKRKRAERMSRELESLSGTREAKCTELVKKAKKKKTRKTPSTDENEQTLTDAADRWKKLLSCMQRKVNEKSTRGCGESHISNFENLVFRSGEDSSILRCVELRNSERVESEVPGLQNDITHSCQKPADDSNSSKLNAETNIGGRKDCHVYESKATDKVLNVGVNEHHEYSAMSISSATLHLSSEGQNVEEGMGWGCQKRSSQHGSSSQDHLEMSREPFANLVSDDGGERLSESEDFDNPVNSKNSLGEPMDILVMKNWNWNKEEMKWKSEADMLSSFEEDPELCVKAICALYRQEISEDEIPPKGLLFHEDTLRCSSLAKFLMDKDCKGESNKSVKELEMFDSKAVEDCKRLVRRYSIYIFDIYEKGKDPFFLPATTTSHGEETSK